MGLLRSLLGKDEIHRIRHLPPHRRPRHLRSPRSRRGHLRRAFERNRRLAPEGLVPARTEGEGGDRREHPGRLQDRGGPEFFAPVVRLEHFACPGSIQDLRLLEADTGVSIHSVDDLVRPCTQRWTGTRGTERSG
jgi:hypothetical protein